MIRRVLIIAILFIATTIQVTAQFAELAQANTYYQSYLFKEAIPLYEKVLAKDPYQSEAMLNLAMSYYYTNNPKKAEVWFDRVVKYENYGKYYFEYGQTLKMNGKYAAAKKQFIDYSKFNFKKGNHYAKSCDISLAKNPMTEAFVVSKIEGINSKSADYAPTLYEGSLIFASARSVAVEKEGQVSWTNDAFNQHYKMLRSTDGTAPTTKTLRSYIGNDINDAPMSYLSNRNLVAITSNNFMDGIRPIAGSGLMMDIYTYQIKSEKEWNRATEEFFPYNANVNSKAPFSTGHPCFANNGTAIYYTSNRDGGYGGYDLYVSYRTATGWTSPENLGAEINTPGNEMTPFVDANGVLYFSSDWHAGYGGMDLFMTTRRTYGWSTVQNMGSQVNSPADDMYLVFDADKKEGYFTSNRAGGEGNEDIYQVKQVKEVAIQQKLAMNIGDKIILGDEYFRSNSGNLVNLNSEAINYLIQRLVDNPKIAIQVNGYTDTKGSATDNLNLSKERAASLSRHLVARGISAARIKHTGYGENFLVNNCTNNANCSREKHAQNRRLEIIAMGQVDEKGGIKVLFNPAPADNAEEVVVKTIKSEPTAARTNYTTSSANKKPKRKSHYAIGDVIEVANIYYEHNSSNIDKRSATGLKQLLDILKEHPHVVIEIGAHTDATGSASYNKELSAKRATAVKKYLEKRGVSASRLTSKGYGESKILNRCKDGVKCSKDEHAINRRTEFKVIAQKGFKVGDIIKVDNINYELDKAKLDMKNSRGLQEIIQLLQDNKISVEIRSHTDARGRAEYNLELSEKRAKAVYDYLIKKGINKYTLKYKGYGETMPVNKCKDGVRCSSSQHAENRRTDFKVIGLK